ncbi:MAG TPA: hypothetical protein VGK88_05360 [bacterium]
MRTWTSFLLIALVAMLTSPVVASHTTRTTLEIDMGEAWRDSLGDHTTAFKITCRKKEKD